MEQKMEPQFWSFIREGEWATIETYRGRADYITLRMRPDHGGPMSATTVTIKQARKFAQGLLDATRDMT